MNRDEYFDNLSLAHSSGYKYISKSWKNGRWNYKYPSETVSGATAALKKSLEQNKSTTNATSVNATKDSNKEIVVGAATTIKKPSEEKSATTNVTSINATRDASKIDKGKEAVEKIFRSMPEMNDEEGAKKWLKKKSDDFSADPIFTAIRRKLFTRKGYHTI